MHLTSFRDLMGLSASNLYSVKFETCFYTGISIIHIVKQLKRDLLKSNIKLMALQDILQSNILFPFCPIMDQIITIPFIKNAVD